MDPNVEEASQAERLQSVANAGPGARDDTDVTPKGPLQQKPAISTANGIAVHSSTPSGPAAASDLEEGNKDPENGEEGESQMSRLKTVLIMGSLCV